MAVKPTKPDPYCAFKDDQERRKALASRDIRDVLVVAVIAVALGASGAASPGHSGWAAWVSGLLQILKR